MNNSGLISVVVPCYNEKESIELFYSKIIETMKQLGGVDKEILFVDDGSKDDTLEIIKKLSKIDKSVNYISFSRNFGKEAAIYAGLKETSGDYVVIMDVDLQDPPELIPTMYKLICDQEYDVIATRRVNREGEPPIRSFFARMFYKIMNKVSDVELVDGARDFRMMKRQVVNAILSLNEYNRFSKGIFGWVGFKTKWLEYENIERTTGETKWSFYKLFLYSLEGISAFSTIPLYISSAIGLLFFIISFFMILFIVTKTIIYGDPVSGWPSTIVIIFLIGGIQLLSIGILGFYLSKTYLETKKRPLFIVKEMKKAMSAERRS